MLALMAIGAPLAAYNPATGDFTPRDPRDIRVLSFNMHGDWSLASTQAPGDRVLRAINPDIILFQEITVDETFTMVASRLDRVLPVEGGGSWRVQVGASDGFTRCALASRFPISLARSNIVPAAEPRGIVAALVDLPDDLYATDLYVMSLHLKANSGGDTESNELRRQASADALMAWIRDIQTPGGVITLTPRTPILYGGDTNLLSNTALSTRTSTTLISGDIFDEATYGPDIRPDWDGSVAPDIRPLNPFNSSDFTWSASSPSIRFDRFYYTDSVGSIPTSFVFNTTTMTSAARTGAGVNSTDTRNTTDHLPVAIDIRLPAPVLPDPGGYWWFY
jgi:endonuclease/exonuclease/phosphatase family metal-dependent hydrolase